MTCHDAREQFSALLDDALAGPERQELDAHWSSAPSAAGSWSSSAGR